MGDLFKVVSWKCDKKPIVKSVMSTSTVHSYWKDWESKKVDMTSITELSHQ